MLFLGTAAQNEQHLFPGSGLENKQREQFSGSFFLLKDDSLLSVKKKKKSYECIFALQPLLNNMEESKYLVVSLLPSQLWLAYANVTRGH